MSAPKDPASAGAFLHPRLNRLFGHLRHVLLRTGALRKHICDLLKDPVDTFRWWEYGAPEDTTDYKDLRLGKAREQGRVVPNIHRLEAEFGPLRQCEDGTFDLSFDEARSSKTDAKPVYGLYSRGLPFVEARKQLEPGRIDRIAYRLDAFHVFLQKWRRAILDARDALSAAATDLDGHTRAPVAKRPSTLAARVLDVLLDAVPSDRFDIPNVVTANPEWLQRLDAASPGVAALVRELRSPATLPAVEPANPPAAEGKESVPSSSNPNGTIRDGPVPGVRTGEAPCVRSWTQSDLDNEIRKYKAERAHKFAELRDAIAKKSKVALKAAVKLFGRNAIARALECKSRAMVGKSLPWIAMADDLGLPRKRGARPKRVGMKIALEETGAKAADVGDEVGESELRAQIRGLPAEIREDLQSKLRKGEMTPEQAQEVIKLHENQKRDSTSKVQRPEGSLE